MELLPVSGSKGSVHRRTYVHHVVSLGNLGPHQLRLDHVDQELLHFVFANLDAVLDLCKTDLRPEEKRGLIYDPRKLDQVIGAQTCFRQAA